MSSAPRPEVWHHAAKCVGSDFDCWCTGDQPDLLATITSDWTITILEARPKDWPVVVHSNELSQQTIPFLSKTAELSESLAVSQPILVHSACDASPATGQKLFSSIVYIAFVLPDHIFVLDIRIQVCSFTEAGLITVPFPLPSHSWQLESHDCTSSCRTLLASSSVTPPASLRSSGSKFF